MNSAYRLFRLGKGAIRFQFQQGSKMHYAYWGLKQPPFAAGVAANGCWESSTHEEAIARLFYLVENRKRLGLLLGESGLGKSLLLEVFACQLKVADIPVAKLNLVGVSRDEVPQLLCEQLRVSLPPMASTGVAWRRLIEWQAANVYQHRTTVVLFDDVDQAEADTLKTITRLLHTEPAAAGRLTMVLAFRGSRLQMLPDFLWEPAELRIDLEPWTPQDTAGYLAEVSRDANRAPIFDDEAVARIHELADGVPRKIVRMADLALLAGAGAELASINADTVIGVAQELQPA